MAPQLGSNIALRQNPPTLSQDGFKTSDLEPSWNQTLQRRAKNGAKTSQLGANMAPEFRI
eukprot:1838580-Karenia_brevis.AAC.1